MARSTWLRRGNTLSLITEMSTIPLFCKLTTDKSQTANCILMQILGTAHSTQPPATVCPSQKVRSVGGAQGATQLRWQRRSGLMRTSQHWLSRLLECTQSLCQHQNSWKGWGWVGGALRDGGWEWGRGGESGRGGFARTVVGAPAVGAAYRSCVVQLVLVKKL